MKHCKYLWLVLCTVFLCQACSSDGDSMADSASEDLAQKPGKVELSIQNESSYSLSDVSWRGIAFYSSMDGRTIPSGSVAKNSVEKNADGYVFFTRCGTVPAKLRSFEVVSVSGTNKVFRIMDNMLVVEVGNTENRGTLADITLSAPDYYTVLFESNGGPYIEPYSVQRGKEITVAPAVQKEGAAFAGWFSDTDFNRKVEFPYVPESDTVLYAEWKNPPHSVPFTGTRSSSTIKIQITPSDDKYFDCYHVVCYQGFGSLVTTRKMSIPHYSRKLISDIRTKDLSYEIHDLNEKYYSLELYVVDKFGQQSEMYSKSF